MYSFLYSFLYLRFLVFHGGSGSEKHEIKTARENGVVKMNVDTDTQWAYCTGLRDFYGKNVEYLKTQVGNPEGKWVDNELSVSILSLPFLIMFFLVPSFQR